MECLPMGITPPTRYDPFAARDLVLQRIGVQPPYFALHPLPVSVPGLFSAVATAEFPRGLEQGPMRGAEVARHGAIAGLCAAASAQPDDRRRHYLAQRAEYHGFVNPAPYGTEVRFEAHCEQLDRRAARARVAASADGRPLGSLLVDYTVLTEAAFERLFRSRRTPTGPSAALAPLAAGELHCGDGVARRLVPSVGADACAGHFHDHPALPVAVLMQQLSDLGGALMGSYWGLGCVVEADDLCWAGDPAEFEMGVVAECAELVRFRGRVSSAGREACRAEITFGRH